MEGIKIEKRKSISADYKRFSCYAKDGDFMEVAEWTNGEGWDIDINDRKHISLHMDELSAINFLTQYLAYANDEENK